jgi:hypothetical protein
MDYYEVTHSSFEINTIQDYCSSITSPALQFQGKFDEFLSLKDENGVSNRDRVISLYTPIEVIQNRDKTSGELLLKVGTRFIIPISSINTAGILTQGIEVVSNDIENFKSEALKQLESDINYRRASQEIASDHILGHTHQNTPNATVWVWCKSLSDTSDTREGENILDSMEGQLIDITPFIQSLNTNVAENGGTWSITLPPLSCKLEVVEIDNKPQSRWVLEKTILREYNYGNNTTGNREQYFSQSDILQDQQKNSFESNSHKQSNSWFHNIISENDVVFIRFETLELERQQRFIDSKQRYISKQNIAGRVYDMIGLVDTNSTNTSTSSNDTSITISGRDLSKLFIEDGVYFYNLENVTGQFRISGKATQKNQLMGRLLTGSLYFLSLYQNNSIEDVLKFVIQQLSSISIVPDSLFFSYGDRRNTKLLEDGYETKKIQVSRELEQRKIVLRNKIEYFDDLYEFLKEIREKSVRIVEQVRNITIGWSPFLSKTGERISRNQIPGFVTEQFMTRAGDLETLYKPTSLQQEILIQNIRDVDELISLELSRPKNTDSRFTDVYASGIWQIVKLVVDKNITKRRVVDSSMSSQNGSLLNFIRKVCQKPFVEFYTDTYGDTFNLITRKPPYDKSSIVSVLQELVIDIHTESIESQNLQFDNTVYSWYSFRPQNVFAGGGSVLPTVYVPALYFEEYANIWGSKPFEIVHNYNPYYPYVNKDGVTDVSRFELQAFEDLKFLVESHAHLPFTRKGTIVLSQTDRRIKKGNFIRNKSTNEIYLVNSVSHTLRVTDRETVGTTTLQVSRGMIEELILGIDIGELKNISYFNIINTNIDIKLKKYEDRIEKRRIKRKKVVEDIRTQKPLIINGTKATQEQVNFAATIYDTVLSTGGTEKDVVVAYTIALAETRFVNKRNFAASAELLVTRESKQGIFGQIATQDFASEQDIVKVSTATRKLLLGGDIVSIGSRKKGILDFKIRDFVNVGRVAKLVMDEQGIALLEESYTKWEQQSRQILEYARVVSSQNKARQRNEYETIEEEVTVPGYLGVDRESIFSTMKVNRDIFNFFLRREQFDLTELKKYV